MNLPDKIVIESSAKLNLHLEVLGARPDGYHEILSLMLAIDLADRVEVRKTDGGVTVECDHPEVPSGPENLCHRAALEFFRAWPASETGLSAVIDKVIPVAGGLGGGSSNAAATLMALNVLTGVEASAGELMEVGRRVGADVPFFLFTSPARARGTGDILTPAPALSGDYRFVAVAFDFGVRAAWAYGQWDLTTPSKDGNLRYSRYRHLPFNPGLWRNDLQGVVESRYEEVRRAREVLDGSGAIKAMMSGSGPTVFGAFVDEAGAHEAMERIKCELGPLVFLARPRYGSAIRAVG